MKNILFYSCLFVLVAMHAIGFYGIIWGNKNYYIQLTWVNLLVTGSCFLIYSTVEQAKNPRYFIAFFCICVAGFLIEVIGVKTQAIFGTYWYNNRLGYEVLDVPLIIGLNWGILILAVAAIAQRAYGNLFFQAAIGAGLLVLLDILIEPVAMNFFYWTWDVKQIPLQNYFAWWIVSFVFLLFCITFSRKVNNRIGPCVYIVQLIFFALLNYIAPN